MIDPIPYLRECRKHWQWLADNPLEGKNLYFLEFNISAPKNACYVCQYVADLCKKDVVYNKIKCHLLCPIKWTDDGNCVSGKNSPYEQWVVARATENYCEASINAQRIVKLCDIAILERQYRINESKNSALKR